MESTGLPGTIQVSERVYTKLQGQYVFERRGEVYAKGAGNMTTYLLKSRDHDSSARTGV